MVTSSCILLSLLISILAITNGITSSPPNIILIMMDDLGYTDIEYNGGIVPTPNLAHLASNGIKINYHYANTICSASRSSLLTGRYAWRTGAANIIYQQTTQHTNEYLPFISNVLKDSHHNYNTAMFGKYHLGYSSKTYLPFNRGFDQSLFFEAGATKYSQHSNCVSWSIVFNAMKIEIDPSLRQQIEDKFNDGFCSHDLWNENYEPMEDTIAVEGVYNERLFTNAIKEYIDSYNQEEEDNPFFIYYAMPTPHWPLEDPPKLYDECENEEEIGDRKAFCNVLMYGDELIGEIVDSLKMAEIYDNTVLIFLSDNGPNPNWKGNDVKLPEGYGQTLPLRGAKGSTFEGGIRTPAFIYGGFVDNNCENVGGDYSNMVHISDWFAIIKSMANIKEQNHIDIDGIDLWPSICHNDQDAATRKVIKHFEMIDVNDKEQGYKASYIRTNEWKLLINSSLSFIEIPSNKYWVNYDDSYTEEPPVEIYQNMMNDEERTDLFSSECYTNHLDGVIAYDASLPNFEYSEIMLFKISEDNIEACNVRKDHPDIVHNLLHSLFSDDNINEYVKYNSEPIKMSKQGALAQIESYDCDKEKSYHLSWHEIEKYSDENDVSKSWDDIFQSYIQIVDYCENPIKAAKSNPFTYALKDGGVTRAWIICVALVSLISYVFNVSKIYANSWKQCKKDKTKKKKNRERAKRMDEYTVLLPTNP